jgi:uncharacterized protein YecE (DUF72 family)
VDGRTDTPDDTALAMTDQPSLFTTSSDDAAALETRRQRLAVTAAALPETLRMGTSSWSFPGWRGIVYPNGTTPGRLAQEGLKEYAKHPLLRTVGIDRSYYAPIPDEDLRRYADQLPPDFVCCTKAPAAVTSFTLPGAQRAEANPDFLSAARFTEEIIEPFARAFAPHTGPFLLQFSPIGPNASLDPSAFAEMLDAFLSGMPGMCEFAVELRARLLLSDAYRRVLDRHAAVHVVNYWSAMPMPGEQASLVPQEKAPFVMIRLLMRPGTRYEQQRQEVRPFNRIVQPDERMRQDVVGILTRAAREKRRTYLLVNNKAEGSAPLTIEAIAQRLTGVKGDVEIG